MTQALAELRGPVDQEGLRLRMAALHGREDPLLDPARFPRLLRQANDAEIADVRKVGEDDYEIAPRRGGPVPPPLPPPALPAVPTAETEAVIVPGGETEPVADPAGGGRENGLRFGVRFRRGSRGGLRTGEIPLVGLVQIEEPVEVLQASPTPQPEAEAAEPAETAAPRKPARSRRAPRKKTGTTRASKSAKAEAPAEDQQPAAAPPAKRPRARARKKAE